MATESLTSIHAQCFLQWTSVAACSGRIRAKWFPKCARICSAGSQLSLGAQEGPDQRGLGVFSPIRVLRVARGPSDRSDLSTNTCQQKASSGVRGAILSVSEAETDKEGRDHRVSQQPHLEMTAPGPQSPAVPQVHRETFANPLTHEKDKGVSEAAQRRRPFWRFSRFITFAA